MSWLRSIEKAMEFMEELDDEDTEGFNSLPTERTSKISPQGWTVVNQRKDPMERRYAWYLLDERWVGCSKTLDDSGYLEHKREKEKRNIARNKIMKGNLSHEEITTSLWRQWKIIQRVLNREMIVRFFLIFHSVLYFKSLHYRKEIGLRVR